MVFSEAFLRVGGAASWGEAGLFPVVGSGLKGRERADLPRVKGSRAPAAALESWVAVRVMESWDALREGGPTKRVGAGRRLGFVFAVGDCLLGAGAAAALLDIFVVVFRLVEATLFVFGLRRACEM